MKYTRACMWTYFHILSTPSCDALTMNWCLWGTTAKSVTKSTWEWLWAESTYVSVPVGAAEVDGEEAEFADWGLWVHISLNTSTPSMIFDLCVHACTCTMYTEHEIISAWCSRRTPTKTSEITCKCRQIYCIQPPRLSIATCIIGTIGANANCNYYRNLSNPSCELIVNQHCNPNRVTT